MARQARIIVLDMARVTLSLRVSETTRSRLRRLADGMNMTQTAALETAIANTLAQLEEGEPIRHSVPSERRDDGHKSA